MLQLLVLPLLLLLLSSSVALNSPNIDNDNSEIANIFKFLEEGESEIKLLNEHKSAILVLGNTGSGKSTFVQWIAGDNDKLISIPVGSNKFIIEDGNFRIGSTVNSKTIIPELVIDNDTRTAIYDCAGFGDTRYDIAATYFTKKVTDHLDNVKLLLTASYYAASKGGHRTDFLTLLRHSGDLIKNIDNFQDSIALVVTKVDNHYDRRGKLPPDTDVIAEIAEFIDETKTELKNRLMLSNITSEERFSFKNAIKITNILLTKKYDNYSRIMIFRRPDDPGPLSKLPLLQEGKKHMKKVLYEELKFTKSSRDFGYTVSEKSKNKINTLAKQINKKIQFEISEIVRKIKTRHTSLIEEIRNTITSFVGFKDDNYVYEENKAKAYVTKLEMYNRAISRLFDETENLSNVNDLTNAVSSSMSRLKINDCVDNIRNISIYGQYFDFLQIVNGKGLNIEPLWAFFEIKGFIFTQKESLIDDVKSLTEKIKKTITSHSESIGKSIEKHFNNKVEAIDREELPSEFYQGFLMMSNLIKSAKSSENVVFFLEKIEEVIPKFESAAKTKIRNHVKAISNHSKFLEFLKILNNGELSIWSTDWIIPFSRVEKYLFESKMWYEFLNKLYDKLSEFEVLKQRKEYNVRNINDWGTENKPQGIKVDQDNLRQFLDKIEQFLPKDYVCGLKTLEVTETHLKSLNLVLDLTIKSPINFLCPKYDTLIITGFNVLFNDFITFNGGFSYSCGRHLNSVYIFSTNIVFIDRDIEQIGSKMDISIVSPKWHIMGYRKINLDGATGESHTPNKAEDGRTPGARGNDGLPGQPGGAAGNFLGIAQEIVYAQNLIISVKGGRGGPGQGGGDGKNGNTGENADSDLDFRYTWSYDGAYRGDFIRLYRYYGRDGGKGGDGGNGGKGGMGGMEGSTKILKIGNNYCDLPNIEKKNGTEGVSGNGGAGGQGGKHGSDAESHWCSVHYEWCSDILWIGTRRFFKNRLIDRGYNQDGRNGEPGLIKIKNEHLLDTPKTPQIIHDVLNVFKEHSFQYLIDRIQKRNLLNFIKELDDNVEIQNS